MGRLIINTYWVLWLFLGAMGLRCDIFFAPAGPIEQYADDDGPSSEPGGACITIGTDNNPQTCQFVLAKDCLSNDYRDGLSCSETLIAACILASAGCRDTVVAGCSSPDEVHPGYTCAQVDPYGACFSNEDPSNPDLCDVMRASQCAVLSNYSHAPNSSCDDI